MNAEEILRTLLKHFYIAPEGFCWSYIEGVSIRDLEGEEFEKLLLDYINPTDALFKSVMKNLIAETLTENIKL